MHQRTWTRRGGFSLLETLVVCLLAAAVLALLLGTLFAQLRLARVTAQRVVRADAVRTTAVILEGEARRLVAADTRALAPDSLAIRSFRGTALVCNSLAGTVRVRYRGVRQPVPDKDSLLVVRAADTRVLALHGSRTDPGACNADADEDVLEWRLSGDSVAGALLLLFESGSYYLSSRALRYRIGGEGRQPLTTESFTHPATGFAAAAGGFHYTLAIGGVTHARTAWFAPTLPP